MRQESLGKNVPKHTLIAANERRLPAGNPKNAGTSKQQPGSQAARQRLLLYAMLWMLASTVGEIVKW